MYADDNIPYFNEGSGNAVFSCNEMGILNIDLNTIKIPDFLLSILYLENTKHLKKR